MQFVIEQKLAQTLLNYLVKLPYREVAEMVAGLTALQPVTIVPPPPAEQAKTDEAAG